MTSSSKESRIARIVAPEIFEGVSPITSEILVTIRLQMLNSRVSRVPPATCAATATLRRLTMAVSDPEPAIFDKPIGIATRICLRLESTQTDSCCFHESPSTSSVRHAEVYAETRREHVPETLRRLYQERSANGCSLEAFRWLTSIPSHRQIVVLAPSISILPHIKDQSTRRLEGFCFPAYRLKSVITLSSGGSGREIPAI